MFRYAVRQTVPIFFIDLFIGIAFGILLSDADQFRFLFLERRSRLASKAI